MKTIIFILIALGSVPHPSHQWTCQAGAMLSPESVGRLESSVHGDTSSKNEQCFHLLAQLVQKALESSLTYLQMSAHLLSSQSYRPGMSKLLVESAARGRNDANKIMEYLLMRGGRISDIANEISTVTVSDVATALNESLVLERQLTDSVREIIISCEGSVSGLPNDHQSVDFLTREFQARGHQNIRRFGELLQTRMRMSSTFGALAEVMLDQSLLKGANK